MTPFALARPLSLADAARAFEGGGEAAYLAGGHTLVPAMKSGLRSVDTLIDLSRIPGLAGISRGDDGRLEIGAMTRHATIAAHPLVQSGCPALADVARQIGDPQVRARGTIGGSLANNDPAADWPAAALALDALLLTDRRTIPAADFFPGMFETALAPGEILTRVALAIPRAAGWAKARHPASRYAVAAVFVAAHEDGWRVAVTGATWCVARWPEAEAALATGVPLPAALDHADLASDLHASAEFRGHLAGVMLGRAVAAAQA